MLLINKVDFYDFCLICEELGIEDIYYIEELYQQYVKSEYSDPKEFLKNILFKSEEQSEILNKLINWYKEISNYIPVPIYVIALFLEENNFNPNSKEELQEYLIKNIKKLLNFLENKTEVQEKLAEKYKIEISEDTIKRIYSEAQSIYFYIKYGTPTYARYEYKRFWILCFGEEYLKTKPPENEEYKKTETKEEDKVLSLENPFVFIFELSYYLGRIYRLQYYKEIIQNYIIYLYYKKKGFKQVMISTILNESKYWSIYFNKYKDEAAEWFTKSFEREIDKNYVKIIMNDLHRDNISKSLSFLAALCMIFYKDVSLFFIKHPEFKRLAKKYLNIDVDKYILRCGHPKRVLKINKEKVKILIEPIKLLIEYVDGKISKEEFAEKFLKTIIKNKNQILVE